MSDDKDKNERAREIQDAITKADEARRFDKLLAGIDGISKRLDALEARAPAAKADYEKDEEKDKDKGKESEALADAQCVADAVANAFGEKAPPPLQGEAPLAFRKRLLRPFLRYSKDFEKIDLAQCANDLTFAGIEKRVYADAMEASKSPPPFSDGSLREVGRRDRAGREIVSFYGNPTSWMRQFSGSRQRLVGIRTRN